MAGNLRGSTVAAMSSIAPPRPAPSPLATALSPSAPARQPLDDTLLSPLSAQFAATAADHDRAGRFPHDNFATLQRHGLVGLTVPTAHGGRGATLADARRVIGAVARGEPATALILTMTYLQHQAIGRADSRWPRHLRERVARDTAAHGALINALRVEPALGSPARGGLPGTVGTRTAEGWTINGHKLYTTGIEGLRWLSVWGRTDDPVPQVGVFLVPRDAPGIRVIESWDHLGLRASGSHEVVFEDVKVPLDHAVDLRAPEAWIPGNGNGSASDIDAYAQQQAWMVVLLGTLYDAVARAAEAWLIGFLQARAPGSLGAPLATLPRVQEQVGEIQALLRTNCVLLDHAAAEVDAGRLPAATDSGLLKYSVTANAIRAVEIALQLSGNHGLSRQNPLERHHRDVLCARIHTPQNDAVLVASGKAALKR